MTATVTHIDPDPTLHPYGVRVGDPVHYWRGNPPPLSENYTAPECQHGLVLSLYGNEHSTWSADIAVVNAAHGSLFIVRDVQQMESFATSYSRAEERSYGVPQSWHREVTHR